MSTETPIPSPRPANPPKKKPRGFGTLIRRAADLTRNALLTRRALLAELFDDRRDIDEEAGYPKTITPAQHRSMYDRGIGHRVVRLMPSESWKVTPRIFEDESEEDTPFEEAWADLDKQRHVLHYMERVDILSGIGRFGIIVIGFNDGKQLSEPVEMKEGLEVNWFRTFAETDKVANVSIRRRNDDPRDERFGLPEEYQVQFSLEGNVGSSAPSPTGTEGFPSFSTASLTQTVHWHRVIHIADNREASEVFGVPRQEPVFDRLLDTRKILGGSGEMFWKGAFPGLAVEGHVGSEIDVDSTSEALASYANGLQRWISVDGASIKTLSPNVAYPRPHFEVAMDAMAVTLDVPKRKLLGSERGELASSQDSITWNEKIAGRQDRYLTPMLVRPLIDRLIMFGVLPEPAEGPTAYEVKWPKLEADPSASEKSKVSLDLTKAVVAYAQSEAATLVPPAEFLGIILGLDKQEVQQVMEAAEEEILREEAAMEEAAAQEEAAAALAQEEESEMIEEDSPADGE